MQVTGVICEYNPFHHGHALHLQRARALSGADYIVCAMSGALTQRGVFARHDKWTRARMALEGGADLVLELPARFSAAPAPEFALGGVSLLTALGCLTHLSFGCERESLPFLSAAARILSDETPAFRAALREGLDRGLSFPQARAAAAEAASGLPGLAAAAARPNAALALEYLRALPQGVTPVPVIREGSGYHEKTLGALASATAVRAALAGGDRDAALAAVPSPKLLVRSETSGDIHEEEALTQALLYQLRTMDAAALREIAGMDEGLEYRFISAAKTAATRGELLSLIKSRRYTHARLSRLCAHILLGVTRDFTKAHRAPTYARVLGFKKEAAPLLRTIKENASIPLVTKTAGFDDPLFMLDVRAQDLWSLGAASPACRACGRDYTTSPVIL
ncbi:MAG: nucleotidyltransferase family protein [Clostridia bacterium]|nr:nucleotidyltransferase family protein [Clostridia bacterium]